MSHLFIEKFRNFIFIFEKRETQTNIKERKVRAFFYFLV
jgi:hypothetical protein